MHARTHACMHACAHTHFTALWTLSGTIWVSQCNRQEYTPDNKLYRHILNTEDKDELQNDIHSLKNWADEWLLKLNVDNCWGTTYIINNSNLCNIKYYTENYNEHYDISIWE